MSAAERRHQFADERILSIVRDGESGQRVADVCEAHGISAQMYYLWKTRYGGLEPTDLQQLRRRASTIRMGAMAASAVAIFLGGLVVGRTVVPGGRTPSPQAPQPVAKSTPESSAASPPRVVPESTVAVPPAASRPADIVGEPPSTPRSPDGIEGPPVVMTSPSPTAKVVQALAKPAPTSPGIGPSIAAPSVAEDAAEPSTAPKETGFAVQVAAVPDVKEADALLLRLTAKGYSAYVLSRPGPSALHRVRVGPYRTRDEAQAAATRLATEEQVKPWITK